MHRIKLAHVIEAILIFLTVQFIIKLNNYSQILHLIQEKYSEDSWFNIQMAIEIASEPSYFKYLIKGFLFIVLLVIYPYILFKFNRSIDTIFIVLINLTLLIILLVVFCNPILTSFAVITLSVLIYGSASN